MKTILGIISEIRKNAEKAAELRAQATWLDRERRDLLYELVVAASSFSLGKIIDDPKGDWTVTDLIYLCDPPEARHGTVKWWAKLERGSGDGHEVLFEQGEIPTIRYG